MKRYNYFEFMAKIGSLTKEDIDDMSEKDAKDILREYIFQSKRSGEEKCSDNFEAMGYICTHGIAKIKSIFKK